MPLLIWIAAGLAMAGNVFVAVAVYHERRMQRHRQPEVTYTQATFRRDGGWRRAELFTPAGLAYQRRAARYGATGIALWTLAGIAYIVARVIT